MTRLMDTIYFLDGTARSLQVPSKTKLKKVNKATVLEVLGIGETKYNIGVEKGVLPRLVNFGPKSKGLYEHELSKLVEAYKADASTEAVRHVVSQIHRIRAKIINSNVDFSRYVL